MEWARYDREEEMWRKELRVEGSKGRKTRGGGSERANSRFLIKQQCSQLIHLICQLGENVAGTFSPEKKGGRRAERQGLRETRKGSEIQGEMERVIESLGGNLKNSCEKQEEVKGNTGWSRCNKRTLL